MIKKVNSRWHVTCVTCKNASIIVPNLSLLESYGFILKTKGTEDYECPRCNGTLFKNKKTKKRKKIRTAQKKT